MLPELQAEQQLLAIEAASVPHMTQQSRLKILNRWGSQGQRRGAAAEKPTPEQLRMALAASGFPIVHVKKKRRKEVRSHGG